MPEDELGFVEVDIGDGEPGAAVEKNPAGDEVLALRQRFLSDTHPQTANAVRDLARIHVAQGRFQEAEQGLSTCYRALLAEHGASHPSTRQVVQGLIDLYEAWGKSDEAQRYR